MVSLIVTDLDGTLLNDIKEITSYSVNVLNKCQKNGIKIAFASARPERATEEFQRLFHPDFVISNNGATISEGDGNVIYNKFIPGATRDSLISMLISMNDVTCLTVEAGTCLYTNYKGESWDSANWNPIYNDFSEQLNINTPKISIECGNNALIFDLISQYSDLHLYFNSDENWSQIMHIDSTKMNAIHYLSALLGIEISNIIAFGDDYNDIEMIEKCGKGVAVENAIELVKKAASCICLNNNENGVANWIERHLLS